MEFAGLRGASLHKVQPPLSQWPRNQPPPPPSNLNELRKLSLQIEMENSSILDDHNISFAERLRSLNPSQSVAEQMADTPSDQVNKHLLHEISQPSHGLLHLWSTW
jgi:hypothetical protein